MLPTDSYCYSLIVIRQSLNNKVWENLLVMKYEIIQKVLKNSASEFSAMDDRFCSRATVEDDPGNGHLKSVNPRNGTRVA